jgi:class 3 adenylate cyclase
VHRTFAFLDLCGFTDFVGAHGDDEAVAELIALRNTVRAVTSRAGVRVDKWLGDGVMLVGVECEPLVDAVVAISTAHSRKGRLPLRAGVAGGEVILLEGDDYVGSPVNLAARLSDRADADQILACEHGLVVPDSVVRGRAAEITLPGFSLPVSVVALATRPRGRRVLPLPRLVRGEELPPSVDAPAPTPPVELSEGEARS